MLDIMRESIWVAIKLGGPMLVASMAIGVVIAIFQAQPKFMNKVFLLYRNLYL